MDEPLEEYEFHQNRIERSRDNLKLKRDRLVEQIRRAFHDVTRDGGISLREAHVIDDYGSDKKRAAARALETDSHWWEVDVSAIDPGGSCMSFMDSIGYRYYLPAYMTRILKQCCSLGPDENDDWNAAESLIYGLNPSFYVVDELVEHVRTRHRHFTHEESVCIALFLAFDAEVADDTYCDNALVALKNHWIEYLPERDRKHLESIWPGCFD